MNALAPALPETTIDPRVAAVVVRLADEGIPVRAIARATSTPSEEIYEALRGAIAQGSIVEMPKDDWPPGASRSARTILTGTHLDTENELKCACVRYFKASPLEAAMLALMLKRNEVTKEQLHSVIEHSRPPGREQTEIKMVDVMICKLRKKLKEHEVEIKTMWGLGYFISAMHREAAITRLLAMKDA